MKSPIRRVSTRQLFTAAQKLPNQIKNLPEAMQKLLGATRQEVTVVFLLFFGMLGGSLLKYMQSEPAYQMNRAAVSALFDSAALVQTSLYSGVRPDGTPVPDLAAADTIVKREDRFPSAKKRESPAALSVDINQAMTDELQRLPGVGPKTAAAIISYRTQQPFRRPEDLMRVKGIGKKTFAKLQGFVFVSRPKQNITSE